MPIGGFSTRKVQFPMCAWFLPESGALVSLIASQSVRIPIYSGRVFRSEAGPRSDLKPATIPK